MNTCSENIFSNLPDLSLIKEAGVCRIYETGSIKSSKRVRTSGEGYLSCLFLSHSYLEKRLFCQLRQEQNFDSFEYIVSGSFFFRSGNQMLQAEKGDLVFLPRGTNNTLLYLPEYGPCEKYGLIPGGSMYSSLRKLFDFDSFRSLSFDNSRFMERVMEQLREKMIRLNGTVRPEELGGLLYEFLQSAAGISGRGGEPSTLCRIRHYLEENLDEEIKIASLAEKFSLPPQKLLALFRDNMKMTPIQYLIHRRMVRAAVLLGDSSLRIKEIAFATGYKDPLYFSTEFRRFYGVSPKKYREDPDRNGNFL